MLKLPDGTVKVLVEGLQRARISALSDNGEHFSAKADIWSRRPLMAGTGSAGAYCNQPVRRLHQAEQKIPPEVLTSLNSIDDPARLADTIAHICR
ncbi:LON peptidase substrate-binding domain-containing protein [Escherichia coli]